MKKEIIRKIYLLSKRQPMKPIEVVQYETGVQLVFEVQDIELDNSATVTLFVRKPSGKFVFQEDNISLTGNTVVIDLHNQAITEYGNPFFQIKFKNGEEIISTYSGMLTVEKSLEDSGAEESKTVIAAFGELTDEQISRIEEATRVQIDLMKAEVEAKGETVLATIPEDYTEMYNRVNTLANSVANAIRGTVSGSVVSVDDVSPVEHKPVVRVVCPEGVDPTTVTVRRCGKNIIRSEKIAHEQWKNAPSYESHGVRWTVSDDRKLTIQGETPEDNYSVFDIATSNSFTSWLVSGVTYTASLNKTGSGTVELIAEIFDKNNGTVVSYIKDGVTFTVDKERYNYGTLRLQINPSNAVNCMVMPQIEIGSAVTDFEPYKEPTEHTPSSDGIVEGITSLSPVMTLLTDTEGVTIECEYIKDTNKVINNLAKAVVALGGAV